MVSSPYLWNHPILTFNSVGKSQERENALCHGRQRGERAVNSLNIHVEKYSKIQRKWRERYSARVRENGRVAENSSFFSL